MHLKRLHLSGFKSFAQKTDLEFSPGISAIVGPNGSGKSNITDAIQWVLGERSAKALRMQKPADVIFAGNEHRKPLSMGEVTIVFDNSDGLLPLPFTEVSITRRIYRSGESDYFINKTPCRLRDILDLLMDTGLGADSFAIINQNQIDAILSLRPEDRRALFEQVAGTQRYQARRAEAMRKLEKTDKNLVRIKDILHELEHQLPPLAEQAEIARRYEELAGRVRQLSLALLGWEAGVRQKRLQRLNEEQAELEGKLTQLNEQWAQLTAQKRNLESELSTMEERLTELQERAREAISKATALEGEIALAQQQRAHLNERRAQLAKEMEVLSQRLGSCEARRNEAQVQWQLLQAQSEEAQKELTQLEGQVQQLEAKLSELRSALNERKIEHVEAVRQAAEFRNQIQAYTKVVAGLEARLGELQREKQQELARLAESRHQLDPLSQQESELEAERERLQEALRKGRQQVRQLEEESEALRRQAAGLRELLSGLKARLNALEEIEESLSGVHQGPRMVLLAARSGGLKGQYHLLAHLLSVPPEYERATEAALGGALQYIVTDTAESARHAIAYLKGTRSGRATFLALDFIRPRTTNRPNLFTDTQLLLLTNHEPRTTNCGFLGWLNDLISIAEPFKAALDYVAGHIAVVKTLEQAIELGRRLPLAFRLVTLDGEFIVPGGTMAGGHETKGQPSLLQRRREIEELRGRIRETEAKVQSLEADGRERAARREQEQVRLLEAQAQFDECAARLERLKAKREAQLRQAQLLEGELERIEAEQKQVLDELERLRVESGDSQRQLEEAESEANRLQQVIALLTAQVEEQQKLREQMMQELAEVRLKNAQLVEKADGLRRELEEARRQSEELTAALRAREEEKDGLDEELRGLAVKLPDLEQERAALETAKQEADTAFASWRVQRKEISLQLERLDEQIASVLSQRQQLEEEAHRLDIRKTQTVTELQELERRITEELQADLQAAQAAAEQLEQKQAAHEELSQLKAKIAQMGTVNLGAIEQYEQLKQRVEFLKAQQADLEKGKADLHEIIAQIDQETREQFLQALEQVEAAFQELFSRIFGGGKVKLSLTEPDNYLESGVDVRVQLPGKAEQDIMALSGGERAMTAVCLVFAMLKVKPAPFCILDEVDAPLDEANVEKFGSLLQDFAQHSQFIVITHNYGTLQSVDRLYGVTMEEEGVSRVFSLALDPVKAAAQP